VSCLCEALYEVPQAEKKKNIEKNSTDRTAAEIKREMVEGEPTQAAAHHEPRPFFWFIGYFREIPDEPNMPCDLRVPDQKDALVDEVAKKNVATTYATLFCVCISHFCISGGYHEERKHS